MEFNQRERNANYVPGNYVPGSSCCNSICLQQHIQQHLCSVATLLTTEAVGNSGPLAGRNCAAMAALSFRHSFHERYL